MENLPSPVQNGFICFYIFNEKMSKLFHFMKDLQKFDEAFKILRSKIILMNGKKTHIIGSKVEFLWNYSLAVQFQTLKNNIDEFNNREIRWKANSYPIDAPYQFSFDFIQDTLTNKVLYTWKSEDEPQNIAKSMKAYKLKESEIISLMQRFVSVVLLDNTYEYSQFESCLINANIEKVWEECSNFETLCGYKENNVKFGNREGPFRTFGSLITFLSRENDESYSKFRINVIKEDNDRNEKMICLEYVEGNPKLPKQRLEILLNGVNDNMTFLKMSHYFSEKLNKVLINAISSMKKKLLNAIKQKLL